MKFVVPVIIQKFKFAITYVLFIIFKKNPNMKYANLREFGECI